MLRVYLIIHVYILERLPEHYIFRVNLGLVINIFTVLGLIFVSRLSFERGDNFLSLFCSFVAFREKNVFCFIVLAVAV